jgi:hypothetical protein
VYKYYVIVQIARTIIALHMVLPSSACIIRRIFCPDVRRCITSIAFNETSRSVSNSIRDFHLTSLRITRKFIGSPRLLKKIESLSKRPRKGVFVDTYFEDEAFTLFSQQMLLRSRNDTLEMQWPHNMENEDLDQLGLDGKSTESCEGISFLKQTSDWATICKIIESVTSKQLDVDTTRAAEQIANLSGSGIKTIARMKITRSSFTMKLKVNDASARVNVTYDDVLFLPSDENIGTGRCMDHVEEVAITPQNCKYTVGEFEVLSIQNYRLGYPEFLNLVCREFGIPVATPLPIQQQDSDNNVTGESSGDSSGVDDYEVPTVRDAALEYMSRFQPRSYAMIVQNRIDIRAARQQREADEEAAAAGNKTKKSKSGAIINNN